MADALDRLLAITHEHGKEAGRQEVMVAARRLLRTSDYDELVTEVKKGAEGIGRVPGEAISASFSTVAARASTASKDEQPASREF